MYKPIGGRSRTSVLDIARYARQCEETVELGMIPPPSERRLHAFSQESQQPGLRICCSADSFVREFAAHFNQQRWIHCSLVDQRLESRQVFDSSSLKSSIDPHARALQDENPTTGLHGDPRLWVISLFGLIKYFWPVALLP